MMGRVTFQDPRVSEVVKKYCVATWKNVRPGYRVGAIDQAVFEQFSGVKYHPPADRVPGAAVDFRRELAARQPDGQASENVATLLATADGELLHVVPGLFSPAAMARELAFAVGLNRALVAVGNAPDARRRMIQGMHRTRLAQLSADGAPGCLARLLLSHVHRRMIEQPLRRIDDVRAIEEFSGEAAHAAIRQKMELLQRALRRKAEQGFDVQPIVAKLEPVDGLLRSFRLEEAEALVTNTLAAAELPLSAPPDSR